MLSSQLVEQKLLRVARSGCYTGFNPQQSLQYQHELSLFIQSHELTLCATNLFDLYEMLIVLSLVTGQDYEAHITLEKITEHFGSATRRLQRLKLLQLICLEAKGDFNAAARHLGSDRDEVRLLRRLVTFSRKNGPEAYIRSLNTYLDIQPGDLIMWGELGREYHGQGQYTAAIFSYQEILMRDPKAYPIYHQVGKNYFYEFIRAWTLRSNDKCESILKLLELLTASLHNYLQCVDLCPIYWHSWLGIYLCIFHPINERIEAILRTKQAAKWTADAKNLKPVCMKMYTKITGMHIVKEASPVQTKE